MKKIVVGILAHVDSGKTTLSEALLYCSGAISKLGRVDHRDSFLDTFSLERSRGITIFSKMARFKLRPELCGLASADPAAGESYAEPLSVTLLDTPGHVDFSAETERTLQVLDAALLLISGTDGVQGHTRTLWRLLKQSEIPCFLFVNKMDLTERSRSELIGELRRELDDACTDFSKEDETWAEECASADEALLESYLENGSLDPSAIRSAIAQRKIFPVLFGSALKEEGIEPLLSCLYRWGTGYAGDPGKPFAGRVYKIGRDKNGARLTYMKILAGTLRVKDSIPMKRADGTEFNEKADQIRFYSGDHFETAQEALPGEICVVTGLASTRPGMGIGAISGETQPSLAAVMTRAMILPPDTPAPAFFRKVKELEEEDPALHILWNEKAQEIRARIMGNVQIEVLTALIKERYGVSVQFGPEQIIYKETVASGTVGIGHFEPLRHYAEVQLLIEPGGRGSGVTAVSAVSEDVLALNWQRLITTHILEKEPPGVLTGSGLTDVKITILTGRAHIKHTEGGDFRQATYRAIRQGLMSAENVLLEPFYSFRLDIPSDAVGRAMTDLSAAQAEFAAPELSPDGTRAVITGRAPVILLSSYAADVAAYTKGTGTLSLTPEGYGPCHNTEEVLEKLAYDPDADTENPSASVFCSHGAGVLIPWDQVPAYAHTEAESSAWSYGENGTDGDEGIFNEGNEEYQAFRAARHSGAKRDIPIEEDRELQAIYAREFGMDTDGIRGDAEFVEQGKYRKRSDAAVVSAKLDKKGNPIYPKKDTRPDYLIVDGYNMIYQWPELRELAAIDIDAARGKLLDLLSNYQGYTGYKMTVVFDAYRTERTPESVSAYDNMEVVFTRKGVTADGFIERQVHEMAGKYRITVATSDGLEQLTVLRLGALRMSASMLKEDMRRVRTSLSGS